MDKHVYWFGSRVKGLHGNSPGTWVAEGPFPSDDIAKRERELAKAPDIDVTPCFVAPSEEEALERIKWMG